VRQKFSRARRLASAAVKEVLAHGRRMPLVRAPVQTGSSVSMGPQDASAAGKPIVTIIESRVLGRDASARAVRKSRLAVAVPKRMLKRAVDRNRVKRWMREAFRTTDLSGVDADVLLTLAGRYPIGEATHDARVRESIGQAIVAMCRQFHRKNAENH
jgi:ribonuclease P protein component